MSEVYTITNLEGYAEEMRVCAAKQICETYDEDLNEYISIGQMINLVKQNCVGFDDENRPMLDEDANGEIFEQTCVWIHNIGLARLAAKDLVQCAWSDEDNTMIFWTDKAENKNESKPKRKRNKKSKG
jgi:hypothetical protein